jgi:hypothetical protein
VQGRFESFARLANQSLRTVMFLDVSLCVSTYANGSTTFKVAFGRSVRLRKGIGISVFSVFDREFEGRSSS